MIASIARFLRPAAACGLALLLAAGPVPAADRDAAAPRPPAPGIYRLADLTATGAARLNREKTLVLLPVAPLQMHGPHLPAGTDLVLTNALVDAVAKKARAANPEYSVLILPELPVGAGSSTEVGNIYSHPATVTLDPDVMLEFLYDWVLNPAETAYWNFFVVTTHVNPVNMKVLRDVCDYYTEVYGMNTVNLAGLVFADSAETARLAAAAAKRAPGKPLSPPLVEMQGGLLGTSLMLAVKPGAVEPLYGKLAPVPVRTYEEQSKIAAANGWLGYFGDPADASAELGRDALDILADACTSIITETAAGIPWRSRPALEDATSSDFWVRETARGTATYQTIKHRRFDDWLKARRASEEEARRTRAGG